jgi:myo-inositol-1(or 4)-monophosphatase
MAARFSRDRALDAAIAATEAASRTLLSRFRPPAGRTLKRWMKSPGALVTDADLASDRAIAEALRSAAVPGRVLSEESGHDDRVSPKPSGKPGTRGTQAARRPGSTAHDELTWLIDPLCGTVPFAAGMDHWGVNIALRRGGSLELGALTVPSLGETLVAARRTGVARNGKRWRPVAPVAALGESTIGLEIDGGSEWRRLLRRGLGWVPKCGQINTFASAAYPMAQVCLGRLPAAVFYGIGPVHLAAGACVAMELGCKVTDAGGSEIDWTGDAELAEVVAGWPAVHAQLIEAMGAR